MAEATDAGYNVGARQPRHHSTSSSAPSLGGLPAPRAGPAPRRLLWLPARSHSAAAAGIVKEVPSGDCMVIMGTCAAQRRPAPLRPCATCLTVALSMLTAQQLGDGPAAHQDRLPGRARGAAHRAPRHAGRAVRLRRARVPPQEGHRQAGQLPHRVRRARRHPRAGRGEARRGEPGGGGRRGGVGQAARIERHAGPGPQGPGRRCRGRQDRHLGAGRLACSASKIVCLASPWF